jgi:hypothetical protein
MVEAIMFFALGFLVASLLALALFPVVHARAARLAARRVVAEFPLSMKEINAERDLLRAEFAMSVRRFEIGIERLTAKVAGLMAELGRKSDEINRLRRTPGEETATLGAPEARERVLPDELQPRKDEPAVTAAPRRDQRSLAERLAELRELNPDLDQSPLVPSMPTNRSLHDK